MTVLPPAPPDDPSTPTPDSGAFLPPTGAQVLRALVAPLIGYAALLVGAVFVTVLVLIAVNTGSTGDDTGVTSDDTNGFGVLIGMPFQIAAMALLGTLHLHQADFSVSVYLPPLLLTAVYLVTTAWIARRGRPIADAGTRALLSAIAGLVSAAIVTPVTWALAMRAEGVSVHAATAGLFFGTWVLTGVATYVGSSLATGRVLPRAVPRDWVAAAQVWLASVALWVVVAVVILVVVTGIEDGLWVALLVPLWGPTIGLDSYALGHLTTVSVAGQAVHVWDFNHDWTVVAILGALGLGLLASVAWHLRRDPTPSRLTQPVSWVALPVVYAAGGLALWLITTVSVGGAYSDVGGTTSVRPAFWLIFVLLAWGGAVEVSSRLLAPRLASALPPQARRVLRGPEPVPPADAGPLPATSRPLTAAERARFVRFAVAGGGVVVVALLGWIAISVVNHQMYGPQDQADAYLDAVVAGNVEEVADLAPPDDDLATTDLLTSAVYRSATHRVTGYTILGSDVSGDTAKVRVRLTGLDHDATTTLTLRRDGHSNVVFDHWAVSGGGLAKAVSVYAFGGPDQISVGGVSVEANDDGFWLLPGDYDFNAFPDNTWVSGSGDPVVVSATKDFQFAELPEPVASDAFRREVQSQIDAYLAACMASTELDPPGCPNESYAFDDDVRNVRWTLDSAPTADFDSFDGTFPADLSYGDSGQATVTYDEDESFGYGKPDYEPQSEESELYLDAVTVTEDDDGGLTVSFDR